MAAASRDQGARVAGFGAYPPARFDSAAAFPGSRLVPCGQRAKHYRFGLRGLGFLLSRAPAPSPSLSGNLVAFPTVQATAATSDGSQHATSAVNLPTGIVAGDLIVIIASVAASVAVSTSGEYTELAAVNDGSAGMRLWVGYKYATGSEGSTVTLSFSGGPGSSVCTAITYRISGVDAVVPPEIATATTAFQASKNPPNLAPSWGSDDNLWITGIGSRGDTTPTVRPTGYGNSVDQATASAHNVYTDRKTAAAASDDPSAYTSAATWYVAFTLAVAPGAASSPAPAPGRSSGSSGKSPSSGGSDPTKKTQGGTKPSPVNRTSSLIHALRRSRHWDIIP